MFRHLAILSMYVHLWSLAASQAKFGASWLNVRWVSLAAMGVLGLLAWAPSPRRVARGVLVLWIVAAYASLWLITTLNSDHPLFSFYRLSAHLLAIAFCLVFLPTFLDLGEASRVAWFLKGIAAVILAWSLVEPAALTVYDTADLFRGVFGNANSLGAMAALGAVTALHGFMTHRNPTVRAAHGALGALALVLLVRSSSRSAMIALAVAGVLLVYLYRATLTRKALLVLLVVALVPALLPGLMGRVGAFLVKERPDIASDSALAVAVGSRVPVWSAHWDGFLKRPVLGWGFGLDADTDLSEWRGELSAIGRAARDPVNDVLSALESGGLVGLLAYLLILSTVVAAWPPPRVRSRIQALAAMDPHGSVARTYDLQRLFVVLSVMYVALFQGDSTAFAAGNFGAATLWVTLGVALWGRSELGRWSGERSEEIPVATGLATPSGLA